MAYCHVRVRPMGDIWRKVVVVRLISVSRTDDVRRNVDQEISIEWACGRRQKSKQHQIPNAHGDMKNRLDKLITALWV